MSGAVEGVRAWPDGVVTALQMLADWLDGADLLIDRLAAARSMDRPNRGDDVQRDMRRLADWFVAHPDAARDAWAFVLDGGAEAQR